MNVLTRGEGRADGRRPTMRLVDHSEPGTAR